MKTTLQLLTFFITCTIFAQQKQLQVNYNFKFTLDTRFPKTIELFADNTQVLSRTKEETKWL